MQFALILAMMAQATLHIQVNVVDTAHPQAAVVQAAPVYIPTPSSMESRVAMVNIRGKQVQLTTITIR